MGAFDVAITKSTMVTEKKKFRYQLYSISLHIPLDPVSGPFVSLSQCEDSDKWHQSILAPGALQGSQPAQPLIVLIPVSARATADTTYRGRAQG